MCTNEECYGRKLSEDFMGAVGDARSYSLAPDASQVTKWGRIMLINELLVGL